MPMLGQEGVWPGPISLTGADFTDLLSFVLLSAVIAPASGPMEQGQAGVAP